jgi:ubiquinone biosynthesis protein
VPATPARARSAVPIASAQIERWLRRLDPRVQIARYRAVVTVLARHGLGVARGWLPWRSLGPIVLRSPDERPITVHVREALEELGTTFIKVGQTLSTRADLLPAEAIAELSKLQDSGPTVDADTIRAVVEAELGSPLGELYAEFEPTPMASASIGQVHAARLLDGREVVVKVQKPGVAHQVEIDLIILGELARNVFRRLPHADLLDPEGLVEEFGRSITAELDYLREAGNADEFRADLADDPTVHIPEVIWSHTTSRVITLERLDGVKVDNAAALNASGVDRAELANRCSALVFRQVFRHGFFHADPHPGNLLVLADGRLGLLDFGMAGRLDGLVQDCLLEMLTGFVDKDVDRVIDGLEALGMSVRPQQRYRLRQDVSHLVEQYRGKALSSFSMAHEFEHVTSLARKYRLRMPSDLLLLTRALTIAEGVGRQLWPDFVTTEVARPYLREALLRRTQPAYWGPRAMRSLVDGLRLGSTLPTRVDRLLSRLERGDLEVGWRPEGVEGILGAINAMVNRLALSILVAAFVIGVAVLLLALQPLGSDLSLIGLLLQVGLGIVVVLALGIAVSLLRGSRW